LSSNHGGDLLARTPGKSLVDYGVVVRIWAEFEICCSGGTVGFVKDSLDDTKEAFAVANLLL
jgi:hypothetical protein